MSGRREEPDPTPVEWPAHLRRPPTLAEEIKRLVRIEVSRAAEEAGFESFEEADDFDVDDDSDIFSEHELSDMQEDTPRDELTRQEKERIRQDAAMKRRERSDDGGSEDVESEVGRDRSGEIRSGVRDSESRKADEAEGATRSRGGDSKAGRRAEGDSR